MEKDFDTWNAQKKRIHGTPFIGAVHEREIWWCVLGLNIGHEQDGKNESRERPALVIRKWSKDTIVVLPLTTQVKRDRYHYVFSHDGKEFAIILSQIRLISTSRLQRRIRKMHPNVFNDVCEKAQALLFPNGRTPAKRGSPEPNGHL